MLKKKTFLAENHNEVYLNFPRCPRNVFWLVEIYTEYRRSKQSNKERRPILTAFTFYVIENNVLEIVDVVKNLKYDVKTSTKVDISHFWPIWPLFFG